MTIRKLHFFILLSALPFIWLFTQVNVLANDYIYAIGNIAGLIGALLMWWQFLLGIRFISRKISTDYLSLIKTHMFLGIYGALFVFLHPIIEMYIYAKGFSFLIDLNFTTEFNKHASFGRVAFFLFLIIWISSAILRGKIKFRPWLYIHYLTYPMLALVFLHAIEIGSFINQFSIIQNYWLFLAATFALMVSYRLAMGLNIGRARYTLLRKQTKSDGITQYTFKPKNKKLLPQVGQFFYIRPSFFSEAHPFTIMKFNQQTGELTFGIKAIGKFTNQLEKIIKKQIVYIDGPYGVFTKEGHNQEPKVIFAGGIGVTPFVELISRFNGPNTYMFYANKKLEDAINRQEFINELGANYKDVISREEVAEQTVIQGRLDADKIKQSLPNKMISEAKFFLCGSPRFMSGITQALKSLGVHQSRILTEEFSL